MNNKPENYPNIFLQKIVWFFQFFGVFRVILSPETKKKKKKKRPDGPTLLGRSFRP